MFQASRNSRGQVFLSMLVIGLGFATSGIAVAHGSGKISSATSWTIFAFGLVVALAGGLNQLFRPGYRATETSALVIEMKEEGWAFANKKGRYTKKTNSFQQFDDRVSAILRRAAEIKSLEVRQSPGSKSQEDE